MQSENYVTLVRLQSRIVGCFWRLLTTICPATVQDSRRLRRNSGGALWARIAQNVKKPPLTLNVIDFDFFGFNVPIWVLWSPLGPKVMIHW